MLLAILAVGGMLSCNSGSGGGGGFRPGGGSTPVLVMLADSGPEQIIEFHATVGSVQMTTGSAAAESVLAGSATVEVTHLAGSAQLLGIGSVPPETYSSAGVTLSNLEVTFIDSTGNVAHASSAGPYTLTASVTSTAIASAPMVLTLDFNLASTVAIDAGDVVTFNTPVLLAALNQVGSSTASQDLTNGLVLDLDGSVSSVASSSFVFSSEQMNSNVTINTDASTVFVDPAGATLTGLTSLSAGKVVELNAVTSSDGKLLATRVEVEEDSTAGMETEGIVTSLSVTLPPVVNVTATDNAAPGGVMPTLGNSVAVTTTATTAYTFDSDAVNMTGLGFTFDDTHLALGQNVEVDTTTPSATAVTADRLKLQQQVFSGTIAATDALASATRLTVSLPADSFLTKLTTTTSLPAGVISIFVYQTASTIVDPSLAIAPGLAIRARGVMFWDGTNYHVVASTITPP